MRLQNLLTDLRSKGIRLYVEDGKLRCDAPRDAVTPALRTQLAEQRDALLAFFAQQNQDTAAIPTWQGPGTAPASFAQERLWFQSRVSPDSPAYNLPLLLQWNGPLDQNQLWHALDQLVADHDLLRTRLVLEAGRLVQKVSPVEPLPRRNHEAPNEDRQAALLRDLCHRPFDMNRDPLVRADLVRCSPQRHLLVLVLHHCLGDGPSLEQLAEDLIARYQGEAPSAPTAPRYGDFAAWQRDTQQGETLQQGLDWWTQRLLDAPPALALPYDHARPEQPTFAAAKVQQPLPADTVAAVRAACRANDTTPFVWFLTAYSALLAQVSGQDDVTVGLPVANRTHAALEQALGLYVNTLVARVTVPANPRFQDVLAQVKTYMREAFDHAETPFDRLVDHLNRAGRRHTELNRGPLFQAGFALELRESGIHRLGDLTVTTLEAPLHTVKTDLDCSVIDDGTGFTLCFDYDRALFEENTVATLLDRFVFAVNLWARRPELRLADEAYLPEADRTRLAALAPTRTQAVHGDSPVQRFWQQADRQPNAVALHHEGKQMSYGDLKARVARGAAWLRKAGVGREDRVAVCQARTPDMVVALLAVQAVGAAYVPLDPAYPHERLVYCLQDSGAALLLSDASAPDLSGTWDGRVATAAELAAESDALAAPLAPLPGQLAHVLYTSGSTGRPKAAAIPVTAVNALLAWAEQAFPAEHRACVLAATSICFDLSVYELFLPLTTGTAVALVRDALALRDCQAPVTLINTVPSAMAALLAAKSLPAGLRAVNMAGEPIPREVLVGLQAYPHIERVANLYGPSEDTTYSTYAWLDLADERPAPIGRPIDQTRVYLLDAAGYRVAPGAVGELCLAGDGLARGYSGRPGLTAACFVPDPYSDQPGARLYRTGDLARLRNDGQLEFLGRVDHQVKLRGFRIELGEIEARLRAMDGVADVAVHVSREQGEPVLATWLVSAQQELDLDRLRRDLRRQVPDYLVPAYWGQLEALPRTPNGKLDRNRLPLPGAERAQDFVAPSRESERVLAGLWTELLGHQRFGIHDSFFQSGGNSLVLTRLAVRIEETFAIEPPLEMLFRYDTLADQAAWLEQAQPARMTVAVAEGADEDFEEGLL